MNRRTLFAALTLALLLITAVAVAYVNQFGVERSASQDAWGQFGDYFAGLLNPIFSLLAFLALMYSLVLQKEETQKKPSAIRSTILYFKEGVRRLRQRKASKRAPCRRQRYRRKAGQRAQYQR